MKQIYEERTTSGPILKLLLATTSWSCHRHVINLLYYLQNSFDIFCYIMIKCSYNNFISTMWLP